MTEQKNMIPICSTGWHRKGLRYQFIITYNTPLQNDRITVSYDWITYKLVKWYHGAEKIDAQIPERVEELKRELGYA